MVKIPALKWEKIPFKPSITKVLKDKGHSSVSEQAFFANYSMLICKDPKTRWWFPSAMSPDGRMLYPEAERQPLPKKDAQLTAFLVIVNDLGSVIRDELEDRQERAELRES